MHKVGETELFALLETWLRSDSVHQVVTANALLVVEAQTDSTLKDVCSSASIVVPESAGIDWAANRLGDAFPFAIAGIDLAYTLCQKASNLSVPIYLFGGGPGVADAAAQKLSTEIPGLTIGGTSSGFLDQHQEELIINEIKKSGARLVLVALGMPRQDNWIHENRYRLPPAVYIGVGGTFDVWAGRVKRAPKWMRNRRLEWLYRLLQEPSRWRRMARLPGFALAVFRQKFDTISRR